MGDQPQAIVELAGKEAAIRLAGIPSPWRSGQELKLFPFFPEAAVLLQPESGADGFLAGNLASVALAEVFGLILSGIWSGRLWVVSGDVRKSVSFRDAQVTFASSSEKHERLGAWVVKKGWVTPEALAQALREVRPGVKVGQVLTRNKVLTPTQLYQAMTCVVRQIVVDLFSLTEGDFVFLSGNLRVEDELKLTERTRDLVLEGVGRSQLLLRLGNSFKDKILTRTDPLPPGAPALVTEFGSGRKVAHVRSAFDGSELEFFEEVERLVASGSLVDVALPVPATRGATRAPALRQARTVEERYQELVKTICDALRSASHDLANLQSFLEDPLPGMEQAFGGVRLSEDGRLDVDRVFSNVSAGDSAKARALAQEALDSFVSYALFSAKNVMSPELAERLASDFKKLREEES